MNHPASFVIVNEHCFFVFTFFPRLFFYILSLGADVSFASSYQADSIHQPSAQG